MKTSITIGKPKEVTMPGFFDNETEIIVTLSSITSGIASEIVRQGGFTFMNMVRPCVLEAHNLIVNRMDNPVMFEIKVRELHELLQELHETTAFVNLNTPKETVKQFSHLGKFNDINPDAGPSNFIDLSALTRNVVNQIVIDHQLL